MADLFKASGGTVGSTIPGTTWAAPPSIFPDTDRNDNSAYSWSASTSTVTLPSSGLADGYLIVGALEFEASHNSRLNMAARIIQASGTGNFAAPASSGYCRDASEDRVYLRTWAVVDSPSASATFQFQWKRDSGNTPTSTDGTVRAEFLVVPLYYSDIGLYESTYGTSTGGTSPSVITGLAGTDGTNITETSDVVSMTGDNKRYLILGGGYHEIDAGRTQRWFGLDIDGAESHGAKGYGFSRQANNGIAGEIMSRLIETSTATRTVELTQYRGIGVSNGEGGADIDASTGSNESKHALVVIELNDNTEVFFSTSNAESSNFATTGPIDMECFPSAVFSGDSGSFTRVSDTAVNVEADMDVLYGADLSGASNVVSSGSRFTGYGELTIDGVEDPDSVAGDYLRGANSTTDTFGWSANLLGFYAFSEDEDLGFSITELAGSEGNGGDITCPSGWMGTWGINIGSMAPAADQESALETATLTLTGYAPSITATEHNTSELGTATLTLTAFVPSAVTTEHNSSELPLASLTLTAFAPAAVTTEHHSSELPLASITLTGFAPSVTATELNTSELPLATLTLTAFAPGATTTEHNFSDLATATITLTAFAPSVTTTEHHSAELPLATLTLTSFAPEITSTAGENVSLETATLTLTAFPPSAVTTEHHISELPLATLTLTAFAPTVVSLSGEVSQLGTATITLTAFAPSIVTTEHHSAELPAADLTLEAFAPQIVTTEPAVAVDEGGGDSRKLAADAAESRRARLRQEDDELLAVIAATVERVYELAE